jgi:uncharacterized protein YceH (UPF0502 family)
MNALLNACNQKTSRDPVVKYEEDEVLDTLEGLRAKGLSVRMTGGGGRVPKHRHTLRETLKIDRKELSVLCVLMLRGPQTVGEIRGRTGRMCEFDGLGEVEETLDRLARREERPLVRRLPRQAGRMEARYVHLLTGQPAQEDFEPPPVAEAPQVVAPRPASRLEDRVAELEQKVEELQSELALIKGQMETFRQQFE